MLIHHCDLLQFVIAFASGLFLGAYSHSFESSLLFLILIEIYIFMFTENYDEYTKIEIRFILNIIYFSGWTIAKILI